jgi:hypothetical protein
MKKLKKLKKNAIDTSDAYILAETKLEQIHREYARLLKRVYCKYELYDKKLCDLIELEHYVKNKLRLNELFKMSERIRVAKENCKIKMNRYKQEIT